MSNRYANLTPSAKIKNDYTKITTGFQAVQDDVDAINVTNTSQQTQITTNDQGRRADLQAHKDSTTAHSADHIAYSGSVTGQTTAKGAIDKLKTDMDAIVSVPNDGNAEITVARQSLDGSAPTTLGDRLDKMEAKQLAAAIQSAALVHGWNYVLSDTDSPLNVRIYGTTRVNLLGKDGNCEDTSKWNSYNSTTLSLDSSSNKKYGDNAIKMTATSSNIGMYKNIQVTQGSYYLAIAELDVGTATNGLKFQLDNKESATFTDTGSHVVYFKVNITNSGVSGANNLYIYNTNASAGQFAVIDGIRLYEISAADYAAIDTMTADQVAARWPYDDDVKHLENPILTASGKNLLPPFTEWTLHANAVVTEPYKLTLNATANSQSSYKAVDAMPNRQYTFSVESCTTRINIVELDKNGNTIVNYGWLSGNSLSINTTSASTTQIQVAFDNDILGAGTYTVTNPQLELGSTASDFVEKNDTYLYGVSDSNGDPIRLASNIDGSVRDELYQQNGQWYKLKRHETGVSLSNLTWSYQDDNTGTKTVKSTLAVSGVNSSSVIVKHDGKILTNIDGSSAADNSILTDNVVYVVVDDDDSGWGEDYTSVTDAEALAYFKGWKMNSGTFGTAYNGSGTKTWTRWDATDNSAAVTTVPTALASGYPGYSLSYELATTVTEAVQVEGALALVEGGNQIKLGEGVIVREPVTPKLDAGYYYIITGDADPFWGAGRVSHPTRQFIAIHRGLDEDKLWGATGSDNGTARSISAAIFDDTKQYYATYIMLDKYANTANATDAEIEYQTSDHSVLGQVVAKQADIETNVSIALNALVDVYARLKALEG